MGDFSYRLFISTGFFFVVCINSLFKVFRVMPKRLHIASTIYTVILNIYSSLLFCIWIKKYLSLCSLFFDNGTGT